jgi:transposase, IS5 family
MIRPHNQVRDRLSSMRLLGLDLAQRIPDAKTIRLFRETLAHVGETLFGQFETNVAEHGFQPRGGQLIAASLVPVLK